VKRKTKKKKRGKPKKKERQQRLKEMHYFKNTIDCLGELVGIRAIQSFGNTTKENKYVKIKNLKERVSKQVKKNVKKTKRTYS
jgi:hypothetical protein